ncbi:MAG: hypothetical protein KGD58_13955 [Candidatus Lokiarchaeota archaeon]|nr:hypothetical protein [Candidatus Lokiarchaeota archaeon]
MSDEKDFNFDHHLKEAQKKVKEFVLEKEQLNSKLKNYIISFQSFDSEIYNTLIDARKFYSKKRYDYNIKIANLKHKKIEYERHWSHLSKKIENFPKPQINENALVLVDYTKKSLEDIENKIVYLNQKLEEQILDIEEENEIIEQLRDLETDKKKKKNNLTQLEQTQLKKLQSSDYFSTQRKIKDLENTLTEIYENLYDLSRKRLMTHKKLLDLCKKAKGFEKAKQEIENELIENKTSAEGFHQLFLKLMNLNRKVLLDDLSNKTKSFLRPKVLKTSDVKALIKKKKKVKRLEQKKLEIALEKQKSGKKLDFYEYQLILKHSKK